jgi:hypothetical protein
VLGTIETSPASDAVAAAPAPPSSVGGLPTIVMLTETSVVPIDQAPVGVPAVAVYDSDGSQQWTSQQDATPGTPVVLPDAGDVDGDGVADLIYATVPADVGTVPGGGYLVLSGADGSTILDSGSAQTGLVTALPLGDVTGDDADEILVIRQSASGGDITLTAEGGDGKVLWTAEVSADAEPTNTATDDASGNTVGFSDVTGDGVPDVVVSSPAGDGIAVEAIDGATGNTVWQDTFEGADSVTAERGEGSEGAHDLIVTDTDSGLSVIGVDGATGETEWETSGDSGDGATSQQASVTPAGDVDGDGVEDVLVTLGAAGPDGELDPDQPGSSYILSGDDGTPVWSGSNGPEGSDEGVLTLHRDSGSGGEEGSAASGSWVPEFLFALMLLALLVLVVVAFRRRKEEE